MIKKLEMLHSKYGFKARPPLAHNLLNNQLKVFGADSSDLIEFYQETNGLIYEWFEIFPLYDDQNIKNTWNSLERINDPSNSPYLHGYPPEIRNRFMIFASIGGDGCALIDRSDLTIWFEEKEELHQTDLSLMEFIETMCKEVSEL